MASKRVAKSAVDWAKFAANVPESQNASFELVHAKSNKYVSKLSALPADLPAIDFASYKKTVPNFASQIDALEKQYKSAQVPYPSPGSVLAEAEKTDKEESSKIAKYLDESKAKVTQFSSGLETWKKIPVLEQLTEQEWQLYFPGLRPSALTHFYHNYTFSIEEEYHTPFSYYHWGNYRDLNYLQSTGQVPEDGH